MIELEKFIGLSNVKKEIYDGYKKKNRKSIKLLLEKFYKINKINEISLFFKSYDLLFKIEKNIENNLDNIVTPIIEWI